MQLKFENLIKGDLTQKGASKMVIGIDIDDTITRNPQFFAILSSAFVKAGHRVIIITFAKILRLLKKR